MIKKLFRKILKHNVEGIKGKFNLLVEWTNHCNIRCNMCPIDLPTMREKGHMSLDLWERILEDCKAAGHYVNWVHHLGEPLLWKHFEKGMQKWRESGLSVKGHISTNGILLDEKKIKVIAETGIEFIRICLDTLKPDVYRAIRNNDKHPLVINNILKMLEMAPDIDVQVQLMRTSLNIDETPEDFFEFFGRPKNLAVFYTTVMDLGREFDFKLLPDGRPDPRYCSKIDYEHCVIGWDGTVGLCCPDYWIANRLGNINNGTISEIFDGEYANKIRAMIREGDFSLAPACSCCSMDHMKSPVRKLYRADEK